MPRFEDVTPALYSLRATSRLFAFSNGKRSEIDAVLSNAGIRDYFEGLVTADDVRSFKPNPAVYGYARRATRPGEGGPHLTKIIWKLTMEKTELTELTEFPFP